MANLYKKPNPSGKGQRWMARLMVNGVSLVVSAQMEAADNKREAQRRMDALEREAQTGQLSPATREWMGDRAAAGFQLKIGTRSASKPDTSVDTWDAAWKAYLFAREAKDTKAVPAGKAKAESKTKVSVHYTTKAFKEWAEKETKGVFLKTTWTGLMMKYLVSRKEAGMASTTLWNRDYSYNRLWGEYLARRGLCEFPDRVQIREVLPEKWAAPILPPPPEQDKVCLEWLYKHRLDYQRKTVRRGKAARDMRCGKTFRAHHSAWCLILLVRGLGCRPSEATALDWSTIDLGNHQVRFVKSKNKNNRTVPILYQWVQDGLAELWEMRGRPTTGPVVLSCLDRVYGNDNAASDLLTKVSQANKFPCLYHLKKAQKCWHEQTIRVGFRPWDVAKWADHSISVQEAHYASADTYLPKSGGPFDYGQFGGLSSYGVLCMEHFGLRRAAVAPE